MTEKKSGAEHVSCSYQRAIYQSENGFSVVKYTLENDAGTPIQITARGKYLPTDSFFDILLIGNWIDDPTYGDTFEVDSFETTVRKTRENVIGYLASGVIKGVGKSTAEKIVEHFGLEAGEILADNPLRLKEVGGIGDATLELIMESYKQNEAIHGLMEYLGQYKVSVKQAEKIVAKFGARSLEIVKNDIYHLCDAHGFGYKTVDNIAKNMYHPLDTFPRVKAAGIYVLKENRDEGHLFIEPDQYLRRLKALLNHRKSGFQFPIKALRELANETLQCEEIVYNSKKIYLRSDYDAENESAKLIVQRVLSPYHKRDDLQIPESIVSDKVALSGEQIFLIKLALYYHTFIITGSPGTGKTAVLDTILNYYRKLYGKNKVIALCAPTGRAARRMSAMTGMPAETIHRKFKLFVDIDEFAEFSDASGYLDADLVVMDETSMTDMSVFHKVLCRLKPSTKLILIGDPDQLASVQPGHVLNELLKLDEIPSMRLTEIFRQADGTRIAENAELILQGNTKIAYENNSFIFLPAGNAKIAQEEIVKLYFRACEMVGRENVQILSPYKKNGECSTSKLNRVIQAYLHRNSDSLASDTRHRFQAGDLIIQNKNKDGINNGDLGEVVKVTSHTVTAKFFEYKTPIVKVYNLENIKLIELAFALTVHKSQGSQYPIVIMPVLKGQAFMLKRNLFRTAITRAEFRVVLVGQEEAVEHAITHDDTGKRNTLLAMRIQHYYNKEREMKCDKQEDLNEAA